jgi:A/G-specific adenine glycosylase
MQKRAGKDIWAGLWEFPLIESDRPFEISDRDFREKVEKVSGTAPLEFIRSSKWFRHKLSHQNIHARFFMVEKGEFPQKNEKKSLLPVTRAEVREYPTSRLIEQFMESHREWFPG